MNEHSIRGGLKEAVGRMQDAAGGLFGDTRTQLNGKMREVAGQAESAYGDAMENLESAILQNPLPAVAVAIGVGFLVGFLAGRR